MVDPFDLMMFNKQDTISVEKRVEYYKKWFEDCRAVKLLKGFEFPVDRISSLRSVRRQYLKIISKRLRMRLRWRKS